MFVVKCTSGCKAGKYLAKEVPGGRHDPYTTNIEEVARFSTWEAADKARCPENEAIIPLASCVR